MDFTEKVTAFITRQKVNVLELLLFNHPHCRIQIPAGTVEKNEDFFKFPISNLIKKIFIIFA